MPGKLLKSVALLSCEMLTHKLVEELRDRDLPSFINLFRFVGLMPDCVSQLDDVELENISAKLKSMGSYLVITVNQAACPAEHQGYQGKYCSERVY